MVTQSSPPDNIPGMYDETKARNLRRSFTRLPVISRTPREKSEDETIKDRTTTPSTHRVPRSDTVQDRTTSYSRPHVSTLPSLPRVAQAHPTSDTSSISRSANRAQPCERSLAHVPPPSIATPSLVSGSTTSSQESSHSKLRRKTSTINRYALRAKSDSESMQEHQHLVDTVHKVRHDNDPFPGAIFGMTLPPPTFEPSSCKPSVHVPASAQRPSKADDRGRALRPVIDVGGPFVDAASSRHSDSPFSYQSTPTSASSFSSFPASSLGSSRKRDSQELPPVERIRTQANRGQAVPNAAVKSTTKPSTKVMSARSHAEPDPMDSIRSPSSLPKPKSNAPTVDKTAKPLAPKKKAPKARAIVGVPPEFAHLDVPTPNSSYHKISLPPRRPSRDGITGLGLSDDTPVVQSNLERTYFSQIRRTPSHEVPEATAESPPQSPRTIRRFSNRSSSRQSTKSQQSANIATPKTPVQRSESGTPFGRKDSPFCESSPKKSKHSRYSASPRHLVEQPIRSPKPEKPRKGPAAGTGHEGYGRFGLRGRASSIFGGGRTSRSSSSDSSSSRKGLSFFSRKKSMTSDVNDGGEQSFSEEREAVDVEEEVGTTSLPTPFDGAIESTAAKDGITSKPAPDQTRASEMPRRASAQLSLSDVLQEGEEGLWLASPPPPKRTTFMQRVRSRMTNHHSETAHEPFRVPEGNQVAIPPPPHYTVTDRSMPLDFQYLERLASVGSLPSQSSRCSHRDSSGREPLVPYQQRHEGHLPSPPKINLQPKLSASPVLLQAKTATPVEAPRFVIIPSLQGPVLDRQDPVTRLRSVGRIPQVTRAVQNETVTSRSEFAPSMSTAGKSTQNLQGAPPVPGFAEPLVQADREFLSFPPRKNSELSYTSSSGLESPCIRRSSFVGEDEVWDEYDNLLDDVMLPKALTSTTSSLGAPFQYGDMINGQSTQSTPRNTLHSKVSKGDTYIDGSRPSTTFTISDYLVDQDFTKSQTSVVRSDRKADTSGVEPSATEQLSNHHTARERGGTRLTTYKPGVHVDNPASAELRFAALMTSKWLSFGRVLFSPAHDEATKGDDTKILIIDGLGKEWSYHCALTYPKCQIYNLSPEAPSSSWETLSNHHHLQHSSISKPFPFPRGFFSAVVFRFPIADADNAYQSCFHEMKRTLRPSGYLEISVLDLDLMNMGSIARKAVRDLKIRMHHDDSQVSLWNHGDAFLTLLGKNGLENVQRCAVGIPVAGRIRKSQDSGSSSGLTEPRPRRTRSETEPEYLKFTEWMQGKSSDDEDEYHERRNDEDITKTVAKIGRWWYSTCYPEPRAIEKHNSIWDTPGLLRECERQGTSFRLLFCYAQKPMCVKRRTASV